MSGQVAGQQHNGEQGSGRSSNNRRKAGTTITTGAIATKIRIGMEGVVTATLSTTNLQNNMGVTLHLRGFWGPTHLLYAKFVIFLATVLMFVPIVIKTVLMLNILPLPLFLRAKPVTTSGFLTQQPRPI